MCKKKRQTQDFNKPKLKYSEKNPRGKKAEWIEFACTRPEVDEIMLCLGIAMESTNNKTTPAGTLLADICRKWRIENQPGPSQSPK